MPVSGLRTLAVGAIHTKRAAERSVVQEIVAPARVQVDAPSTRQERYARQTAATVRAQLPWAVATFLATYGAVAFFEIGLNAWDVAAGSVLVLEAGGLIGDLSGEGDYLHGGQVIAATPKVFAQIVKTLAPFREGMLRERAAAAR